MKQYVIDELRPADHEKLKAYLDSHFAVQGFDDLYWISIDADQLSEVQKEHQACGPFYFAMELFPDRLCCELLVRGREKIRCNCIQYSNEDQRNWLIRFVDAIFEKLEITT
jgi:hypothetical protein